MTDREMLEFAAKAAGIELKWGGPDGDMARRTENWNYWNPRTDDGDALRLAVKLKIEVLFPACTHEVWAGPQNGRIPSEDLFPDALSATRLAITRAAAEIGKAMT